MKEESERSLFVGPQRNATNATDDDDAKIFPRIDDDLKSSRHFFCIKKPQSNSKYIYKCFYYALLHLPNKNPFTLLISFLRKCLVIIFLPSPFLQLIIYSYTCMPQVISPIKKEQPAPMQKPNSFIKCNTHTHPSVSNIIELNY